jgi:hypothetical protein
MGVGDEWPSEAEASGTMDELLRVLRISDQRELYQHGIEQGQAAGRPVDGLVDALTKLPGIAGLDALRASRRVVELLTAARWHMMRQAREEGASWNDIGQALGMTRQAAHDFYRRKIERQEQDTPGLHNTTRSRAVLDAKAGLDG